MSISRYSPYTLYIPTKPLLLSPSLHSSTCYQIHIKTARERPRSSETKTQSSIKNSLCKSRCFHFTRESNDYVVPPLQHTVCRRCRQTTLHFCMDTSLSLKVLYITHHLVVVSNLLPAFSSRNVMIGCMSIPMTELIGPDKVSKTTVSPVT